MTLDQIIAAENMGHRATRAVRPFVQDAAGRDALNRADYLLSEARHFAVCWDEIRTREDAKQITAEEATKERQAVIQRLSASAAPQRM